MRYAWFAVVPLYTMPQELLLLQCIGLGSSSMERDQFYPNRIQYTVHFNLYLGRTQTNWPCDGPGEIFASTWPCSGWMQHGKLSMRYAWFAVVSLYRPSGSTGDLLHLIHFRSLRLVRPVADEARPRLHVRGLRPHQGVRARPHQGDRVPVGVQAQGPPGLGALLRLSTMDSWI